MWSEKYFMLKTISWIIDNALVLGAAAAVCYVVIGVAIDEWRKSK